jgi:hypothetical protein
MAYLGQVDRKASNVQVFNVTSSTSATHSIGWTPPSEQTLIVTINGVKQHTNAYSFSGATLTLGAALVATDELEVIGINDIGNSLTPVDGSVSTSKLGDDSVSTAKVQDNAVTLAKMAGGTDGNLITYDASGDPAYVATGAATNILTSNGAGAAPTFQAAAAGGLTQFSQWRLTADFTGGATPIASNLAEVATPVGFGKLPDEAAGGSNSMAESSGIFTFPSTGYWMIKFDTLFFVAVRTAYLQGSIMTTTNDSTYATAAMSTTFTVSGPTTYTGGSCIYIMDVTSTSTHKVRFDIAVAAGSPTCRGDTGRNETCMTFIKLADT